MERRGGKRGWEEKRHPEVHLLDFKPRNGSGLVRLYQYQHHEAVHADVYGRYNNSYLPRYSLKSVETLSERRKLRKKIKEAGMPRLRGLKKKLETAKTFSK
mgnify:FL=1